MAKKTKVRKFGNSNCVIIPAEILSKTGMGLGEELSIWVDENNNIVISGEPDRQRTTEMIDEVYSWIDDPNSEKAKEISRSVIRSLKLTVMDMNKEDYDSMYNLFEAYKEDNTDHMFKAICGGYQLMDILNMSVFRKEYLDSHKNR